jgi:hypothetical protein
MAKTPRQKLRAKFEALALDCLRRSGMDRTRATEMLQAQLKKHPDLMEYAKELSARRPKSQSNESPGA